MSSEVDWLGDLPEGWQIGAIGQLAWVRARLGWKGLTADEYVDKGGVPMLATPNIKGPALDLTNANRVSLDRYEESPEIQLSVGDVLLTKDGSTIGTTNHVRELCEPATVNGSIAVLTPGHRLHGRFLYWFLTSAYAQAIFNRLRDGMGIPHLFQRDIKRIRFPLPPVPEQVSIADYLDRETAQIDTLIAKQEQLIATLRERRGAFVEAESLGTHSQGPAHAAPLEFAPFMPAHWGRAPLKLVAEKRAGATPDTDDLSHWADTDDELGTLWVAISDMSKRERVTSTRKAVTTLGLRSKRLSPAPAGTVLFAMYASVGEVAILGREAVWNQAILGLTPDSERLLPDYLAHVLRSLRRFLLRDVRSNTQSNLNAEQVGNIGIPLPPLSEQREIVERIGVGTSKIDTLIAKAERFIELSKERRAALITAAVTGQIEVPGA